MFSTFQYYLQTAWLNLEAVWALKYEPLLQPENGETSDLYKSSKGHCMPIETGRSMSWNMLGRVIPADRQGTFYDSIR
jgi:hypothetical protein